jgi:hypothetical protein
MKTLFFTAIVAIASAPQWSLAGRWEIQGGVGKWQFRIGNGGVEVHRVPSHGYYVPHYVPPPPPGWQPYPQYYYGGPRYEGRFVPRYVPPPYTSRRWFKDRDDYEDWLEDQRERYEDWREDYEDRLEELRERQRDRFKRWHRGRDDDDDDD